MKMYISKAGDTLATVASKKQISLDQLLIANPGLDAHVPIAQGSKLKLPEVKAPEPKLQLTHLDEGRDHERDRDHDLDRDRDHDRDRQQSSSIDIDRFFAPYYAYQKRWLEQVDRYEEQFRSWTDRERQEDCDEQRDRDHDHDQDSEHDYHQHTAPKRRKTAVKPRKKKRKLIKKRLHPKPLTSRPEPPEDCPEQEPVLPWLNV